MIYYVDNTFDKITYNPFQENQPYSRSWIMLKLLDSAAFKQYTGGGRYGIFQLIITKKNADWKYRICDFIDYETYHDKNIILAVNETDLVSAREEYEGHNFKDKYLRPYENRILVHSTSKENYENIIKDGSLKSWNLLKQKGKIAESSPIGDLLGDPYDYSDYVMFSYGGISIERVISSRQKKRIEMDIDAPYVAGARLYFDAQKIAKDGLLIRDGAHVKVEDSLSLDRYLIWTATPAVLNVPENTSPRIFAEAADAKFTERFGFPLPRDTRS